MKNFFTIVAILAAFSAACFGEPPPRDGIAIGYMTTPNSLVYRSSLSDDVALDFWLDVPEFTLGDYDRVRFGFGAGYAMFLSRRDDFAFMLRPQMAVAYVDDIYNSVEMSFGVTGAVVAYLDHIGMNNVDIYAGGSLGTVIEMAEGFTAFHLLLTRRAPFGLVIGIMYYF